MLVVQWWNDLCYIQYIYFRRLKMAELINKGRIALYYQLKDIISEKIDNKEWLQGEQIPTENELCKQYKVSRITVRQALAELEKEGRLVRKQGMGTFVSFNKIEQDLVSFYSFSEIFKKMGLTARNEIIGFSTINSSEDISKKFKLNDCNSKVHFMKRLRFAGDILFAIERTWLPAYLFPNINMHNLEEKALYDIMRDEYKIIPDSAHESFGAISINKNQAKLFDIREYDAALDIQRITYSGQIPIEYTVSVVRGDKFRFHINLGNK